MHAKLERLLSKSLTTLEVMAYYLVVHTGPGLNRQNRDLLLSAVCLKSQQIASVSQERVCSDNCTCYCTEIEVADQTFYLTRYTVCTQYTDTRPTHPSADLKGTRVLVFITGMAHPRIKPWSVTLEADALPLGQRGSVCLLVGWLVNVPATG